MPKPAAPVLGRLAVKYGIELLKTYGIAEAAAALHYLPEETLLGTAGSVKHAEALEAEPFAGGIPVEGKFSVIL